MSRATLNNIVEDFLRLELGYGEEFAVNNEAGILYDVEETDNLEKKLSDLGKCIRYPESEYSLLTPDQGIKSDSLLTVVDEDEENPRVNLVINVQES